MDYICKSLAVSDVVVVVLEAAEFDREVILAPNVAMFVGFDDTNMARISAALNTSGTSLGPVTRFVLPSSKDLWAKCPTGIFELNIIATATEAP